MRKSRYLGNLFVAIGLLASAHASGQGVIGIDDAGLEVEILQDSGRFTACGIRVIAAHVEAAPTTRVWDVTLSLALDGNKGAAVVKGTSYDFPVPGGRPMPRPAPVEFAFSVQGDPRVIQATGTRPALTSPAASLAGVSDEMGFAAVLNALRNETPILIFFRPKGLDVEVLAVSGKLKPAENDALGQCLRGLLAGAN